jgi:peptidoglycan/xylan/chitin deacetylase (PgdA/CDA1 family)
MGPFVATLLALAILAPIPVGRGMAQEGPPPRRTIAITFDDLPVGGPVPRAERSLVFRRLLARITDLDVPAIGFVNERQLYPDGGDVLDSAEVYLLRAWSDAGLELGNHSYSHPDLHRQELAAFEQDVLRGEVVTRQILAERGRTPRFFRYPFLHTGRTLPVRDSLARFLRQRGYAVAPVTHDNAEWIFALAYERATGRGDAPAAARIAEAYVPYMERKLDYWERQSVRLFGREIPQVLLLHANRLNADGLPALVGMLRGRGYRLVPLDQALRDPAFDSPDSYAGPAGISWLHRWALTRGREYVLTPEPSAPEFVLREAGVESE